MKRKVNTIDKTILSNEFDEMDNEIYYSSVSQNMCETSKITSIDLSKEERFSEKRDNSDIFEFIQKNETRYIPYIDTLKSGLVRVKNPNIASKIYTELKNKFSNDVDNVELFSVIIDYFGFNEKEYFDKLLQPLRMELIKDLSNRIDLGYEE